MNHWVAQLNSNSQIYLDVIEQMIDWLCAEQAPKVLDAGCGRGEPALLFATRGCQVVGVDADATMLESALQLVSQVPFAGEIKLQQGDIAQLRDADGTFDLVWTSAAIHHVADKVATVKELGHVLKPGGRLAIREGNLPLQFLPFDVGLTAPGLQDRLHVADNQWFVSMTQATQPEERPYPYGWLQLLHDAGFANIQARTFMLEALPPFTPTQTKFMTYHLWRTFERDRGIYGPLLNEADRHALQQLLDPSSPHYVLARTDLHLRYSLCIYVGEKTTNN
ncbi:MAG: class I SAM-dependent methyltransferase [Chloroflexota bacterium]